MKVLSLRRTSPKLCMLLALIVLGSFSSGCFSTSTYRVSSSVLKEEPEEATAERVSDGSRVRIKMDLVDVSGARHSSYGHIDVKGKTRTGMIAAGTVLTLIGGGLIGFAIHGGSDCRTLGCSSTMLFGVGGAAGLALGLPMLVMGAMPRDPELH